MAITPQPSTPTPEDILAGAMGPSSATFDGMSVVSGNTMQQLEALAALQSSRAGRKRNRGLSMARIVPGSAVGGRRIS